MATWEQIVLIFLKFGLRSQYWCLFFPQNDIGRRCTYKFEVAV